MYVNSFRAFEIEFKLLPPKPLTPEEELATCKLGPAFRLSASRPSR